jgi:phosphoribosylformimino-5-aminoimidazole carboxamide ribotide isomerase
MIEIIPAIDILDGKCVRLSNGDFSQVRVYSDEPVEIALAFAAAGVVRLHVVDLDGARSGNLGSLGVLNAVANATSLVIDFSGGIRSAEDVRRVFEAGASIACMGSVAISDTGNFFEMLATHGPERIILAADVRGENIAVNGWQADTETRVIPFLSEYVKRGGRQAMITDIARDGILAGPSFDLYSRIHTQIPGVDLIASGGVCSLDDIEQLERIGCSGVIVGKAIYEGNISIDEIGSKGRRDVSQTNHSVS